MRAWREFARLLAWAPRQQRLVLLLLMLLAGISEGIGVLLLVPLLSTLQGDVVTSGSGSGSAVAVGAVEAIAALALPTTSPLPLLAAFCVLLLLRNAVQYARELAAARLQQHVSEQLREAGFAALLGAQWRWLVTRRSSDHASLILSDIGRIGVGLGHGLAMLASVTIAAVYLVAGLALSWKLALVASLSGALLWTLLFGWRRGMQAMGHQLTQANQRMHAGLQDRLAGLRLAKILGAEARTLTGFVRDIGALRDQHMRFASALSLSKALQQSVGALLLALYVYLGLEVWRVPTAELLGLVVIFARLLPLIATAQQQQQHWLHAMPAFAEAERQLAESRAWAEPDIADQQAPLQVARTIALREVEVRYPGRTAPALQAVSLTLPVRTTTAIVGASGAGKSTLADVLAGLLSTDHGSLEIDGVALDARMRRAWRRSVAYVSQQTFLLNDSIRRNLLLVSPQASDASLQAALEQAAAQFVHDLPQGLDTLVGEGGVQLSGGERQRLALARALLQRPALLILDEATSALDHANEAHIRAAIERLQGDLTVVVVGHRLALLEQADHVVVLAQGRASAQGRWDEVAPAWRVVG